MPHLLENLRVLAHEPVRSVRASFGIWDAKRPTEGAMTAFIEFEGGISASLTYSGYDHFDSDELHHWIGGTGRAKKPNQGGARRAPMACGVGDMAR